MGPCLMLLHRQCTKQQRYSDDCGLFMIATLCVRHLTIRIADVATMSKGLRAHLASVVDQLPPRRSFWKSV